MPNYCENNFFLNHKDPEMISRATKAFNESRFCEEFIPFPQGLKDTKASAMTRKKVYEENVRKYGYAEELDFCVDEWGTKWDVGGKYETGELSEELPNDISGWFDSAWTPPTGLYKKLVELGFEIEATYYEPGGGFVGKFTNEGGDERYILGKDDIPAELDEEFGISDNEQEDEEE